MPVNYFADDTDGKTLTASVEDEKLKLLRLVAKLGSDGDKIYKEAQDTARGSEASAIAAVGDIHVPEALLKETGEKFATSLDVFDKVIARQAEQAKARNLRKRSIEGLYKDNVSADQGALFDDAQRGIDAFANRGRGGGGGGGGSGYDTSFGQIEATLPADYFAEQERLLALSDAPVAYEKQKERLPDHLAGPQLQPRTTTTPTNEEAFTNTPKSRGRDHQPKKVETTVKSAGASRARGR